MAVVSSSTLCVAATAADPAHPPSRYYCNLPGISYRRDSRASCNARVVRFNSDVAVSKKPEGFRTAFLFGVDDPRWKIHGNLSTSQGRKATRKWGGVGGGMSRAALDALIFDCDGVILESEELHRSAYNLAFEHFSVSCGAAPVLWDTEFYDVLQNTIGGGKPKMRWYFGKNGWPTSTILDAPPESESDQATLIDTLQDWKTNKYKDLIVSVAAARPGVLELMDEARSRGLKVAVCSAATKSSVVFCILNLLGKERFERLDCFLAGDDVKNKKPDPSIYKTAAEKLGAEPDRCLVIEDSVIGLQAALGAGMSCIITYTSSTSKQDFSGAKAIYPNLAQIRLEDLTRLAGASPVALQNP